jgi:hypothetical protein
VQVYDGTALLGETVADANGYWSFRPSAPLTAGQHVLTAVATSADGGAKETAPAVTVTVRTRAVSIPSWKPAAGSAPTFITPADGSIVNTVQPLFAGTAASNAVIRLYDGEQVLGEATADADGRWSFRPPIALAEGEHTVTAAPVNADGTDGAARSTLRFTIASGLGVAPAQTPLVSTALPGTLTNSRPVLAGQATPGATIRIYDGDQLVGEAKTAGDGQWYFVPMSPLSAGPHVLRVEAVGADGTVLASAEYPVTVSANAKPVGPPKIAVPAQGQVAPGDILSGTAPPGSQVQIYEGGALIGGATAGANGKWRFRLPRSLAAGRHEIHVAAVDQTGSPVSQSEIARIVVAPPRTLPVTGAARRGIESSLRGESNGRRS